MTQVVGRGSVIALLPKHNFRRRQRLSTVKFLGPGHGSQTLIMDNNVKYYKSSYDSSLRSLDFYGLAFIPAARVQVSLCRQFRKGRNPFAGELSGEGLALFCPGFQGVRRSMK